MDRIDIENISNWYTQHKEEKLFGRRITLAMIEPIINCLPEAFNVVQMGASFNQKPIYKISIGKGPIKILIWSQMHGNESTGTKAIFDLFKYFSEPAENKWFASQILDLCTLTFIPMLNPDGAEAYTRVNAQDIDLNRDAVSLKTSESKILNTVLKEVKPQFCFNLHDQRTIFSVGKNNLPATISFLAPSENKERTVTKGRKVTMAVITAMKELLDELIPGQIGRYTDEFYPAATGDNFQKAGHNTILIEAGHYKDDYDREEVRKYNFLALLSGLNFIANEKEFENYKPYFDIPDNESQYLDRIYMNIFVSEMGQNIDVGVVYKEELVNDEIVFKPTIKYTEDLSKFNANQVIDKKGTKFKNMQSLYKLFKN